MEHTIVSDYDKMSVLVAQRVALAIRDKAAKGEKAVIGLATGSTPIGVYKELVRMHEEEGLSFENVVTFNLDEYIVDAKEHPDFYKNENSYHGFMEKHLFSHVAGEGPGKMKRENIHIPDTMAADLDEKCRAYERAIKEAGGIDLQLLGIGKNGHLGFCEPGSPMNGRTSVVNLTPETIAVNKEKFGFAAPTAISMGLGTIREAREILLIASGETKASPIRGTRPRFPSLSYENPASILRYHKNAHIIADNEAALYLDTAQAAPRLP